MAMTSPCSNQILGAYRPGAMDRSHETVYSQSHKKSHQIQHLHLLTMVFEALALLMSLRAFTSIPSLHLHTDRVPCHHAMLEELRLP